MSDRVEPGASERASRLDTGVVPLLRVVNSDATPEEIAALVTVLSTLGSTAAAAPTATHEWNAPSRLARRTIQVGPGGWRASGLPTR